MNTRKIGIIGRTYRHMQRYREILTVLFRFGFGDLVASLKVEHYLDLGRRIIHPKRAEKIETLSRAERLRMVLEELGPTFIKLGQVLSTRPQVLPQDFIEELVKLQDEVPPFPYSEARLIIEAELKKPLEEIFQSIESEPLAAASIGQVHRARLVDGGEVVIKVQRPGIRATIEVDLEIMFHIATLMERHLDGVEIQRPAEVVEEFARTIEKEMDYRIESANMERFAGLFIDEPKVCVPRVFSQATTGRILTMEYVDGIPAGQIDRLRDAGYDLRGIAGLGADLILEQILAHGFFHADPHPGNILILPGQVVCFLDMGMMGRLTRRTREAVVDLVMALVRKDESAVVDVLLELTEWEYEPDRRALERETADFVNQHLYRPLKELELGNLFQQLFSLAAQYRLRVPADLLLLLKALTSLEGLGSRLDPDFDMIAKAKPFVRRVRMERLHPGRVAQDLWDYGAEILDILREVPGELKAVLHLARRGKLKIEFEHRGLENMLATQDRISNRISFAIVLASLVIGSSLVILSGIPPKWHEVPIIGLAGYVVAGLMGFWLLVSILRGGRM